MRLDKNKFIEKFNGLTTKLTELSTTDTTDINIVKANILELINEIKDLSDIVDEIIGAGNGEIERLETENENFSKTIKELQDSNAELVKRLGVIALEKLDSIDNNDNNNNNIDLSYDELIKKF